MTNDKNVHEFVKQAYASVAKSSSCCSTSKSCCGSKAADSHVIPESELGLSCGDPVAFSQIKAGDTILDLGSGGGKDVFTAAMIAGPAGLVIGVDMTDEMLDLAKKNALAFKTRTGLDNVEFRKGYIEDLPVDNSSIDVVISNCVINLSPDKPQVFREVFRVLKPGGRMVVSDIVLNRELPESLKNNQTLYSGCIAGALLKEDYLDAIRSAGFGTLEIVKDIEWSTSQAGDDPITGRLGDILLEVSASSITVIAAKNPAD
jgi:SAM-dependent methyltransferase